MAIASTSSNCYNSGPIALLAAEQAAFLLLCFVFPLHYQLTSLDSCNWAAGSTLDAELAVRSVHPGMQQAVEDPRDGEETSATS